jgi:periplasmic divalent cation tolerance protein
MSDEDSAGAGMLVVLCTFPDTEKAREICTSLVTEGLAACANLVPKVESIYRWKGDIHNDRETLAILKLPAGGFAALESKLLELHPYDVPEIVAIRPESANAEYLAWVTGT